jgi:glycosyltransferase involved in cell wall biosynthesis
MKASAGNRVLMLIENSTYPVDPRVHQEATTLAGAGYQVSVICPRGTNQPWHENLVGVSIFRYPAPPQAMSSLGYVLEYIYSFVATFVLSLYVWAYRGFDIIHAANPPDTAVFIAMFYRLFGKRFVFDHHDLAPDMYLVRSNHKGTRLVYQMLSWLEKTSFQFAHHVIATNQSYKNVAMQLGHVPEERITIVRNGPALDRLKLVQPDPDLKKRGAVIIGYVGVMGPQDGLDYLLRALQQLINVLGRSDFFCIIIGKGSALADLITQARQLGIDPYVWFTGFIPDADVIRYLSTIDIGVDPDPSNSFNDRCTMIKMMEYMALSKPIVAFDLPEHRVTAGEAAIFARPNDELNFARQLATLMDDPERREKMGQIGRKRVENELAWPYQAEHLLDAYKSVTAHQGQVRRPNG